ncbi:fluoride efflux transporter FluC [Actinoalloteichus spitiensis]|uniref:fluoride efflux transporter FluC n=1 Tax=Actinoalloteichus spitiensis TaxID=252394 RepID=UPI000371E625|nr:CrcB family protein [Actinoalloteichus spitiensis]
MAGRGQFATVVAVALGGVAGSLARYGVGVALPSGGPSLATWAVNLLGSFLIGVVAALVPRVLPRLPLLRPFLVTGVLSGFTTFSAHSVEVTSLLTAGRPVAAVLVLTGTLLGALVAVAAGDAVGRRWIGAREGRC